MAIRYIQPCEAYANKCYLDKRAILRLLALKETLVTAARSGQPLTSQAIHWFLPDAKCRYYEYAKQIKDALETDKDHDVFAIAITNVNTEVDSPEPQFCANRYILALTGPNTSGISSIATELLRSSPITLIKSQSVKIPSLLQAFPQTLITVCDGLNLPYTGRTIADGLTPVPPVANSAELSPFHCYIPILQELEVANGIAFFIGPLAALLRDALKDNQKEFPNLQFDEHIDLSTFLGSSYDAPTDYSQNNKVQTTQAPAVVTALYNYILKTTTVKFVLVVDKISDADLFSRCTIIGDEILNFGVSEFDRKKNICIPAEFSPAWLTTTPRISQNQSILNKLQSLTTAALDQGGVHVIHAEAADRPVFHALTFGISTLALWFTPENYFQRYVGSIALFIARIFELAGQLQKCIIVIDDLNAFFKYSDDVPEFVKVGVYAFTMQVAKARATESTSLVIVTGGKRPDDIPIEMFDVRC